MLNQPWVGFSWEGWIIEQILIFFNNNDIRFDGPYYFRTNDGYELDLIITLFGEIWGIEIKLTTFPTKHDLEKLQKTGRLINADRMALISKTKKTIIGTDIISTNLRHFLKYISKKRTE